MPIQRHRQIGKDRSKAPAPRSTAPRSSQRLFSLALIDGRLTATTGWPSKADASALEAKDPAAAAHSPHAYDGKDASATAIAAAVVLRPLVRTMKAASLSGETRRPCSTVEGGQAANDRR